MPGTGKSSTVKAVANYYKEQGLRLVELKKSQLHQIPELIDRLSGQSVKIHSVYRRPVVYARRRRFFRVEGRA